MAIRYYSTNNPDIKLRYRLPEPYKLFCGKESLIEEIKKSLRSFRLSMTAICGMGGVGKTEVVKAFAKKYIDDYPIILYIIGDTIHNLHKQFKDVANEFEIQIENEEDDELRSKSMRDIVKAVYNKLRLTDTLIIFDNVDDSIMIKDFLPQTNVINKKLHILFTSRDSNWDWKDFGKINVIQMNLFSDDEASDFIVKALNMSIEERENGEIVEFCNLLNHLPVVINMAAVYINNERKDIEISNIKYTLGTFIEMYKTHESKNMNHRYEYTVYQHNMRIYWSMVVEYLLQCVQYCENSIVIIKQMAYFPPCSIPTSMFKVDTDVKMAKSITPIERYWMMNRHGDHFKMHPLMQEAIKLNVSKVNNDEKYVLDGLTAILDKPLMFACQHGMIELVKHIVKYNFDVNEIDENNSNPLFYASNLKILKILVDSKKFDLKYKNRLGRTVWLHAFTGSSYCQKVDLDMFKYFHDLNVFEINERDIYMATPLMYACLNCSVKVVKYLVDSYKDSIDFNDKDNQGRTILTYANQSGNNDILKYLTNELKLGPM